MDYISVKGVDKPAAKLVFGMAAVDPLRQDRFDEMARIYLENGGNVFDCGRFYGVGCGAEIALGSWLERTGKRDQVLIIDKCCHPFTYKDQRQDLSRWRVSPEFVTEDLCYSLDRMGVDYFDLYLLHRDNPLIPAADLMDRLERHRREGRIRAYGVSNWSLPRVEEAMDYCQRMGYQGLSVSSPSYSLAQVNRPRWFNTVYIGDEEARRYGQLGLPLLSWSSQGSGFFTGAFTGEDAPDFMRECYFSPENFEKLRRVQELAGPLGAQPINIALAYVLSQPFPVAAVVGPESADEMASCCRACDIHLTPEQLSYLSLERDAL